MSTGAGVGWTCTRTGSVKYQRPPKPFTIRDLYRVARKMRISVSDGPELFAVMDVLATRWLEIAAREGRRQLRSWARRVIFRGQDPDPGDE